MALIWIPATLSIGLLIAAIYLGGRIVAAHSAATAPVRMAAAPVVQTRPSPVASAPVPESQKPEPETLPVQTKTALVASAPVAESQRPEPATAQTTPGDEIPMINPQAGQRYIQVGALDLEATRRYIGHLRQANLEPHVAPGPKPDLLRILLGPFADHALLTSTTNQLESAGIKNFVRKY